MRYVLSSQAMADVVVLGACDDRELDSGSAEIARILGVDVSAAVLAIPSFRGSVSDAPLVIPSTQVNVPTVIVGGLGSRSHVDAHVIRTASMRAAALVRGHRTMATALGMAGAELVRAAVEGTAFGCFHRPRPGSSARPAHEQLPEECVVVVEGVEDPDNITAIERGRITGEQLNWVRTLTDTPAGHLTPTLLAQAVADAADDAGVPVAVWSHDDVRDRGFGGLLAVAQGSAQPPQVVELRLGTHHAPLGLTGKGITFDAGGINLKKPLSEVHWMKSDMASAAAVAGAVIAAKRMGLLVDVVAILPMTENMVSGTATRPGDIAVHPNGMTTEVLDTDCEGRVILADGIAYLANQEASAIIDVGTLTDAAGFGPDLWAGASNDDNLMSEVLSAGYQAGDRGWQMPLVSGYVDMMRSQHADLINGPITIADSSVLAATYLSQFAGDTPWVHIDTGSKAYITSPWGEWPEGATGAPMRALLRLLESRAASDDQTTTQPD